MKTHPFQSFIGCLLLMATTSYCQVPAYNSNPGASATIYLDFDGQKVEGTSWNTKGPILCSSSNLNETQINEIFNRVAEDFRPFDLNVTTDSARFLSAPSTKKIRIILTTTYEWYGPTGGVSFLGSFTWGDNTPAFVFTSLLNYNTKYIAEASAHEAGHTLSLRHQSTYSLNCIKTAEYNPGAGIGEIAWAPIMGVGYYKNFTLWNNGNNPQGCTIYQDDLDLIIKSNGFGYRADDHANETNSNATPISFVDHQFKVNGIIEKTSDKDVFRFHVNTYGKFHLDAFPFGLGTGAVGSNLDLEIQLINNDHILIGNYNPENILRASIDTLLLPGTYYLRVGGRGNQFAPEYASLGAYTLQGSCTPVSPVVVERIELKGQLQNHQPTLVWTVESDKKVKDQVLETSGNGYEFHTQSLLNTGVRMYHDPNITSRFPVYYRLLTAFDNGIKMYSNTIRLAENPGAIPQLIGNCVHQKLEVNSTDMFMYLVFDHHGTVMKKGKLVPGINTINSATFSNGIYLIQFSNGQQTGTEKFMKQ